MGLNREDLEEWGAIEPGQPVYSLDAPPEPPPDAVDDRPMLEGNASEGPRGERVLIDGEEYFLTLGQLEGTELIPGEILFKNYELIDEQGVIPGTRSNFHLALANMAQTNPDLFYEQWGSPTDPKRIEKISEILFKMAGPDGTLKRHLSPDEMIGFLESGENWKNKLFEGKTDKYYADKNKMNYGEELPYVSPYTSKGQLTIHNPLSSAFPIHQQEYPNKKSGWEDSGWSNPMDIRTAKAALEEFGPDPDRGMPQDNMNQYLVDQMEGLPKQLNSMYGVDPIQTEPEPMPQQQLVGMTGGGMQSPPPGMVTGQPQEPMTLSQFDDMNQSPEQEPMEFDQTGYDVERAPFSNNFEKFR